MLRLILPLLLLAVPTRAEPFRPSPAYTQTGPETAAGALVWLHGGYDSGEFPHGPPEQPWIARLAHDHFDIFRFDRPPGTDALAASTEALAKGLAALRAAHYRRIILAGHSRGAFIALAMLARPDLVDAIAALSPAAHGTRPERRPQALADFQSLLAAARGNTRLALVLLADDPFDPNPDARAAAARTHANLLLIDRPSEPHGHTGTDSQLFDQKFGEEITKYLEEK